MAKETVHSLRGSLVESIYRGDIAIVDVDGNLLYKWGEPKDKVTFIRSSAKPIQAIPVVKSGAVDHFEITEEEMAVFCASHSGEEEHVGVVTSILKKIGLDPTSLQCGVHPPIYSKAAKKLVEEGVEPFEVHCNCSGKHSGMLTLAQFKEYPVENYTDIEHPVQQEMLQAMADLSGLDKEDIVIGVDGCGVPVHGLSVYHMARAWAQLANPKHLSPERQKAVKRIATAMMNNPSKVAGSDRFCTALMTHTNHKLIGKSGAQGVYCMAIFDKGIGIALKMEDGNGKAASAAAVEVLKQLDILEEQELAALANFHNPKIKNHRKDIVGELKPIFTLDKAE